MYRDLSLYLMDHASVVVFWGFFCIAVVVVCGGGDDDNHSDEDEVQHQEDGWRMGDGDEKRYYHIFM